MHGNSKCQHSDTVINGVKNLQNDGKAYEVLQEVERLRRGEPPLSEFQSVVMDLHELGALFAIGVISIAVFVKQTEAMAPEILEVDDTHLLPDMKLWRVRLALDAGCREVAKDLVADFYGCMPVTHTVQIYGDIACAYIYDTDGDVDVAVMLCNECLQRVNRDELPCVYEGISRDLAKILGRAGRLEEARTVLRDAGIAAERIEVELARFR